LKIEIFNLTLVFTVMVTTSCASLSKNKVAWRDEKSLHHVKEGKDFYNKGDWERAIGHYKRALDIIVRRGENVNQSVADLLDEIGLAYYYNGNYDDALVHHRKSLELRVKLLGPNHLSAAKNYHNIGMVFKETGDYEKAIEFLNKSVEIKKDQLSAFHPALIKTYAALGDTYKQMKDYDNALIYYQKLLAVNVKNMRTIDRRNLAVNYNRFGALHLEKKEFGAALNFFTKSLTIYQKFFSEDHTGVGMAYYNIGLTYQREGDNDNAIVYFEKAAEHGHSAAEKCLQKLKRPSSL
jgi:tetratricopeptide (TPR) repeat protein